MLKSSRGFTLIEVLVSMIILAIGLLGLAAMQAMSLRDNQDAYYYQQATLFAYEMQDRIRGNNNYWSDWNIHPVAAAQGNSCNAPTATCDEAAMAAYDYWLWEQNAAKVLPVSTSGTKLVDIQLSSSVNKGGCMGTYDTSLCLITTWARTNANANSQSKLSADATFYLEVTP